MPSLVATRTLTSVGAARSRVSGKRSDEPSSAAAGVPMLTFGGGRSVLRIVPIELVGLPADAPVAPLIIAVTVSSPSTSASSMVATSKNASVCPAGMVISALKRGV